MKLALALVLTTVALTAVAGDAPAQTQRPETAAAEPKKPAGKKQQAPHPRPDASKADGKTAAAEGTRAPQAAPAPGGSATPGAKGEAAEKPCEPVKPCAID